MPRALISVSDKRGIVSFAEELVRLGWEVVSTGGTASLLRQAGVAVTAVDQVTGFPEILDGRVKTLHPAVHAGLLSRPDRAEHVRQMSEHRLARFDLVAVNLYPFQATIANPGVKFEDAIENIDIGGPSMLRSAAKNFEFVLPVVDPKDYPRVIELIQQGEIDFETRRGLAAKVFSHTADYDSAVAAYLTPWRETLPDRVTLSMERRQVLRYGENPQQRAGLYVTEEPRGIGDLAQRQGKELSFNNLLDIDSAMTTVAAWPNRVACAVIKHTTP
jgi:phosphoribosylaminoimidazolecarboxamide formyltransferase/IMP cyclohydrolase